MTRSEKIEHLARVLCSTLTIDAREDGDECVVSGNTTYFTDEDAEAVSALRELRGVLAGPGDSYHLRIARLERDVEQLRDGVMLPGRAVSDLIAAANAVQVRLRVRSGPSDFVESSVNAAEVVALRRALHKLTKVSQ